jgi:hypothetical protein
MELLQELTRFTKDDTLVLAVVKSIFGAYPIRLTHFPVRVLLVSAESSMARNAKPRLQRLRGVA